jgi:hypothetical protein
MIDSLKKMFDTIRKECDFKTVEDYNKFMELGINYLEKFKEADDYDLDMIIELQEKVEGLEVENGDMAEKHAEKDIAINNLSQDYKRLKEALEEISQIGYSDKFCGGWTYTGEYHARCMKIAMETLKKSY